MNVAIRADSSCIDRGAEGSAGFAFRVTSPAPSACSPSPPRRHLILQEKRVERALWHAAPPEQQERALRSIVPPRAVLAGRRTTGIAACPARISTADHRSCVPSGLDGMKAGSNRLPFNCEDGGRDSGCCCWTRGRLGLLRRRKIPSRGGTVLAAKSEIGQVVGARGLGGSILFGGHAAGSDARWQAAACDRSGWEPTSAARAFKLQVPGGFRPSSTATTSRPGGGTKWRRERMGAPCESSHVARRAAST